MAREFISILTQMLAVGNILPWLASASSTEGSSRVLQATVVDDLLPSQTYFVPFPEDELFNSFDSISPGDVSGEVETTVVLSIGVDGTVLYYSHWEESYRNTIIWGDGDSSNGCSPRAVVCTNETDVFMAGDTIFLDNLVDPTSRGNGGIVYDGADMIRSTYPIAMTRAAFPEEPGSLLAGAVEVLDIDQAAGMQFLFPLGEDSNLGTDGFELVQAYVMAVQEGNTTLSFNGVVQDSFLTLGESIMIDNIKEGDVIVSNQAVQVYLLTGDVGSRFEMRWYSLLPFEAWGNEYINPVSDSETAIHLYNPNAYAVTVEMNAAAGLIGTVNVGSRASALTSAQSATRFRSPSGDKFIAFSITDATVSGQIEDWGAPLIPTSLLTPQALVGWGAGCTGNDCGTDSTSQARNLIWVTPVSDAWIHVDKDGDGLIDDSPTFVAALSVEKFEQNQNGWDMSGVYFTATSTKDISSPPVNIAVAWGQDPMRTFTNDQAALDLGTLVPPYPAILDVVSSASIVQDQNGDGFPSVGDTVEYIIQVQNVGPVDLEAGSFSIVNENLNSNTEYVESSTNYIGIDDSENLLVPDGPAGLPLNGAGLLSQLGILKRGGTHQVKFQVTITNDEGLLVTNSGIIDWPAQGREFAYGSLYFLNQIAEAPTGVPTKSPTALPSISPTRMPTASPTKAPTFAPTNDPTMSPTRRPTSSPTKVPTKTPTYSPTDNPTTSPTRMPTASPTYSPTQNPSTSPTRSPSGAPSSAPSTWPSSTKPSKSPSFHRSKTPSNIIPSAGPTIATSTEETNRPSGKVQHGGKKSKTPTTAKGSNIWMSAATAPNGGGKKLWGG